MERESVERGIGCAAVLPGALIGLAGLADGIGPTGWRGFSEFFGWVAICLAASLTIALLLAQIRSSNTGSYVAIPIAIAAAGGFTFLIYWLNLGAPMSAKRVYTTLLQIVGSFSAAYLVILIVIDFWRRRH